MNIMITELNETDDWVQYCSLLKQLSTLNIENITLDMFKSRIRLINLNPSHKIIIAKHKNIIIGTTTILLEPKFIHDLSYVAHIEDVVVDKDYRSKGIGKLLVQKAINISKESCCYKIILDCSDLHIGFYQKMGFHVKENQMALYI